MKILLINPPYHRLMGFRNIFLPLGISTIAAYSKKVGREIKLYNAENPSSDELNKPLISGVELLKSNFNYNTNLVDDEFIAWKELRSVIQDFKPDLVGLTVMTCKYAPAVKITNIVKEISQDIITVWGGPHCSADGHNTLEKEKDIDYIIPKEGEIVFESLLKYIEAGGNNLASLPALIYRDNGKVTQKNNAEYIDDLNLLPYPERNTDIFQDRYPIGSNGNIMASRGCPYKCTFCDSNNVWGFQVRPRNIENILGEMRSLKENYGIKVVNFVDDTFTLNKNFTLDFCDALKKSDLEMGWTCTTRLNVIDDDICIAMKESGVTSISCGIESGSNEMLKKMKKSLTIETIKEKTHLLKKYNIDWHAFVMVGLPYENLEDINATRILLRELKPTTIYLSIFTPYPGSVLFKETEDLGMLPDNYNWGDFSHQNLNNHFVANISKEDFREIVLDMFLEFDKYNLAFDNLFRKAIKRKKYYFENPGHFASIVLTKFKDKLQHQYKSKS